MMVVYFIIGVVIAIILIFAHREIMYGRGKGTAVWYYLDYVKVIPKISSADSVSTLNRFMEAVEAQGHLYEDLIKRLVEQRKRELGGDTDV